MFTNIEDRIQRAAICQKCEWYIRSTKQCKNCGCLVNLKVAIAKEECPVGKWHAVAPGTDFMSTIAEKIHKALSSKK